LTADDSNRLAKNSLRRIDYTPDFALRSYCKAIRNL
jgi:hypothetical protein